MHIYTYVYFSVSLCLSFVRFVFHVRRVFGRNKTENNAQFLVRTCRRRRSSPFAF